MDMGVVYEGFVGDAARTFPVGKVSDEARRLMRITEASTVGIEQARAGNDVYSIGAAVQDIGKAPVSAWFGVLWDTALAPRCMKSPKCPTSGPACAV